MATKTTPIDRGIDLQTRAIDQIADGEFFKAADSLRKSINQLVTAVVKAKTQFDREIAEEQLEMTIQVSKNLVKSPLRAQENAVKLLTASPEFEEMDIFME
jgi:N-acetylmuramic acid 6-phosphate (MurNAc-6-P) etherase